MAQNTWPARPLFFALLLGLSTYCIYHLLDNGEESPSLLAHWRLSSAAGWGIFAIGFGLCAVRHNILLTAAFSVVLGLMVAGISYWRLQIHWPYIWNFCSLGLALLIILPFFQASLASHWNNYRELHKQAWGNTVVLLLSLVFTAISFGMAHLLANLFDLIGIKLLEQLLDEDYVNWVLGGVAFGGAMGVLREHDSIIDATQRLVQSVLSLLALPLSFALVVFIATLPLTGLQPLWEATRSTSPIVFACALGSILLLNAVIRESDSGISAGYVIQLSARALAIVIAPLAAIAVVSITTRVQQYGWTPDRLWASLISALLLIYGLLYLCVLLPNIHWKQRIRNINLRLGLLTSGIALLLSTPLLDFGAISSRDQIQRLASGKVAGIDFDAATLAFDFGPAGRAALEALDTSENELLAGKVTAALTSDDRWEAINGQEKSNSKLWVSQRLVVYPEYASITPELLAILEEARLCHDDICSFLMDEGGESGIAVRKECYSWNDLCHIASYRYANCAGKWQAIDPQGCKFTGNAEQEKARFERQEKATAEGKLETRSVERYQLFIDGEPVGNAFK